MEGRQRLIPLALAAVIAVVAFVALRPSDDDEPASTPAAQTETTTTPSGTNQTTTTETPKRRPQSVRIRVRDGKPVGGVKTIRGRKGRTIRFLVQSDAAHGVHLHGYDISKHVTAERAARFRFEAEIDGIFEIELEDIGEEIASLRVEP